MKQVDIKLPDMNIKGITTRTSSLLLSVLLLTSLTACDSIPFIDNKSDYKGASRARPLEVPPDLTASPSNDTYSIPGSTSYSSYTQAQEGQETGVEKILQTPEGVHLERSGVQSWLVVNAPAEKIWPVIREFWLDMGFAVRVEDPQLGMMETEWIETDAIKKDQSGNALDKFDKWLDKLSGLADRKKFRTRLDRGTAAGSTEIYMSHRSVSGAPDDGKNRVVNSLGVIDTGYALDSQKAAPTDAGDAELDAELLRRLMVKLGVEEQKSKTIIAQAVTIKRAEVVKESDGSVRLLLNDQFDRAWRRVGLALDRIGFVIEDKDRSNGLFFVRYADVDIDDGPKEKKGLMDSLKFWGDDNQKQEQAATEKKDKSVVDSLKFWQSNDKNKVNPEKQYRIKVADAAAGNAEVVVVDVSGKRLRTTTANRIIALMYEQLK